MSRKYKFYKTSDAYFISFATVNWIDVFTREICFSAMLESLKCCRSNKTWRFMVIALCKAMYI
jgi:hypothetical protein